MRTASYPDGMEGTRECTECGADFAPRREHARFCSARCRATWNRARSTDPAAGISALEWSIAAMSDTTTRLQSAAPPDVEQAHALIGEAVWRVTIVDATLVRHHPEAYDQVIADQSPAEQRETETTLAGLRHVRNRLGAGLSQDELVEPADAAVIAWTWKDLPRPCAEGEAQVWEMERYDAYRKGLAGHQIGETFEQVVGFLSRAADSACLVITNSQ
jgi:hypothetical protein